jgi:acetylglutamate kinase
MSGPLTSELKSEVLVEALPYISRYEGKTFVVKYGGSAMTDDSLKDSFSQDVTLLRKIGIRIVIVHGGGKEVTELSRQLGIETTFVDGQRYTDSRTMEVVQMVLAGKTNKDIVRRINRHDGDAVGLCGIDAHVLRVIRQTGNGVDLGLVGEVTDVNTDYINLLLDRGIMPVIAPLGVDHAYEVYNINADTAAAAIAGALRAEKLVYLSDVPGLIRNGTVVGSIDRTEGEALIGSGVISDGMIPKIRSAFRALERGVGKVHLIDGRITHSLLLEIFTDQGIGTELVRQQVQEDASMDGVPAGRSVMP